MTTRSAPNQFIGATKSPIIAAPLAVMPAQDVIRV